MRAYVEDFDHPEESLQHQEKLLPALAVKDEIREEELRPNQHLPNRRRAILRPVL